MQSEVLLGCDALVEVGGQGGGIEVESLEVSQHHPRGEEVGAAQVVFPEVLNSEVPDVEGLGQVPVEVVAPGHHFLGSQG